MVIANQRMVELLSHVYEHLQQSYRILSEATHLLDGTYLFLLAENENTINDLLKKNDLLPLPEESKDKLRHILGLAATREQFFALRKDIGRFSIDRFETTIRNIRSAVADGVLLATADELMSLRDEGKTLPDLFSLSRNASTESGVATIIQHRQEKFTASLNTILEHTKALREELERTLGTSSHS